MPKKILLFYNYFQHHVMIERLATEMAAYGVGVDVLCRDNFFFISHTGVKWAIISKVYLFLLRHIGIVRRCKFFLHFFYHFFFSEIASHYDLVDFHVFSLDRIHLMKVCQKRRIPFDITLWGSEVLRASQESFDKMAVGFEACRFIKASNNLRVAISDNYSGRFDDKLRTVFFGNGDYEVIDSVDNRVVSAVSYRLNVSNTDCIIACGYNAIRAQQHLRILKSLSDLPFSVKSTVLLLLQMTYPSAPDYINTVSRAADQLGIRYVVIDKYLSSEEVAAIRKLSSIVVNMQTTDAFSGSLQDALYVGNILIIGEWLSYPLLEENGVFFLKASFASLADTVADVVLRKDYYQSQCTGNHDIMKSLTSWPAVIGDWAKLYIG